MTTWGYMQRDMFYIFYNKDTEEMQKLIPELKKPLLLSSSTYSYRDPEHLLYIFPAVNKISLKRVTFIFRLNTVNMRLAMRPVQYSETEKVYILLPDGEILLSADKENYDLLQDELAATASSKDDFGMMELDGVSYYYNKVVSLRGLIFLRLVSENVYIKQMSVISTMLILLLAILMTVGVAVHLLLFP